MPLVLLSLKYVLEVLLRIVEAACVNLHPGSQPLSFSVIHPFPTSLALEVPTASPAFIYTGISTRFSHLNISFVHMIQLIKLHDYTHWLYMVIKMDANFLL